MATYKIRRTKSEPSKPMTRTFRLTESEPSEPTTRTLRLTRLSDLDIEETEDETGSSS
jgi:hypothetical protein